MPQAVGAALPQARLCMGVGSDSCLESCAKRALLELPFSCNTLF